jgi:hypothetical protein
MSFQTAGVSVSGDRYFFIVHSAYVPGSASTFDTGAEDQLAWDEFGYDAILATMDGAP